MEEQQPHPMYFRTRGWLVRWDADRQQWTAVSEMRSGVETDPARILMRLAEAAATDRARRG